MNKKHEDQPRKRERERARVRRAMLCCLVQQSPMFPLKLWIHASFFTSINWCTFTLMLLFFHCFFNTVSCTWRMVPLGLLEFPFHTLLKWGNWVGGRVRLKRQSENKKCETRRVRKCVCVLYCVHTWLMQREQMITHLRSTWWKFARHVSKTIGEVIKLKLVKTETHWYQQWSSHSQCYSRQRMARWRRSFPLSWQEFGSWLAWGLH